MDEKKRQAPARVPARQAKVLAPRRPFCVQFRGPQALGDRRQATKTRPCPSVTPER